MTNTLRPVAVVGGMRIPFCRSNTAYSDLSNLDMLTTTLKGLVEKYNLTGEKIDEVNAGAVINHSRDWNVAREAVLGTGLSPLSPAITMQQACATSLQAALVSSAKIASGQIDCAIAAGADTVSDVPIVFGKRFARRLVSLGRARSPMAKLKTLKGFGPGELKPLPPSTNEPRTLLSMGQHCELMAQHWGITREAQDASEEWARGRGLPILAYLTHAQTSAVDFVEGEGLLMAPAVAMSEMLTRANMSLQDFDFYEIHEAFAAQVLCTLAAWESEEYCRDRLGRNEPMGSIDRNKLNVVGSSLAVGHPFAATGARIVATLGKILDQNSGGKGVISVCTAGGMGVTAILER